MEAGIPNRKLRVKAYFLSKPLTRREHKVSPDLLIPGSIATPWAMPISKPSILLMFDLGRIMLRTAVNWTNPVIVMKKPTIAEKIVEGRSRYSESTVSYTPTIIENAIVALTAVPISRNLNS